MFDDKKLSDLKVGDISGFAFFIVICIVAPFFAPILAIGWIWFRWLDHKDKLLKEKWQLQREEEQAARQAQSEAEKQRADDKTRRILAEIRQQREAENARKQSMK